MLQVRPHLRAASGAGQAAQERSRQRREASLPHHARQTQRQGPQLQRHRTPPLAPPTGRSGHARGAVPQDGAVGVHGGHGGGEHRGEQHAGHGQHHTERAEDLGPEDGQPGDVGDQPESAHGRNQGSDEGQGRLVGAGLKP